MAQPVAFVTGASAGIGFESAKKLASNGFTVYAGARRVDRMEPLKAHGINVLPLDVTDDESMRNAVGTVLEAHPRIDVLVNNAGYGSFGALEEVDLAEGRRQFDVNVFGLARMTQLVLPAMRAAGQGRIINISSIGGKFYEPLGTWYHSTKFAVEGLSDALRLELKPHGVSVSIIEPASTQTEWGRISAEGLLASSGRGPYTDQAKEMARCWHPRTSRQRRRPRKSLPTRSCMPPLRRAPRRAIPWAGAPRRSWRCGGSCRTGCTTPPSWLSSNASRADVAGSGL